MKLAVIKEHRNFFKEKKWIEFENVIQQTHLQRINEAIESTLSERLQTPFRKNPSDLLFTQGHDLWRSNEEVRRFVCQSRLAQIVAELIDQTSIRLGYDQFFPVLSAAPTFELNQKTTKPYAIFCSKIGSLNEVSSLEGLLAGIMICLKGEAQPFSVKEDEPAIDIFPKAPGHVIIFDPTVPVSWNPLPHHQNQSFLLIALTQQTSFYQPKEADPHAHTLKRLGYVINDKLNNKLHPLIYI